jgi:hypothetical protein
MVRKRGSHWISHPVPTGCDDASERLARIMHTELSEHNEHNERREASELEAGPAVIEEGTEDQMSQAETVSLGDLIALFFEEFLALYGDEDLASVAAAATINELLATQKGSLENAEVAA